ncbi:hypothetical protein BDV33DRAFT_188828 [Aspergillus novoparasiticus]|uniref:Uncharacterized protein n=1 Tax=Aspergillus novoparasiticus TaxID=986946 RepID=A0A5N6F1T5_9EURO|nr:hypothetical protein BDV33DRAFT_188828 [Aspergillus novoparasiticus]
MSQEANTYVLSHQLLSNWNDELEYLGYILAEIVDPPEAPDSRLSAVLSKGKRRKLIRLMSKSRKIRNAMHRTKDKLSGQLQSIICLVASTFNIDHV